jgi:hypothetical protein
MSDKLAEIETIVSDWAESDPDGIDDLDALCQIAAILDIEVEAREEKV